MIGEAISLVILLAFSAFFSSAETALLSLNKLTLKSIAGKGSGSIILKKYPRFLITILIGNNLVNLSIASLATSLVYKIFPSHAVSIATFSTTLVVLTFGEIFPKSIALKHNKTLVKIYIPFLLISYYVFLPFTLLFEYLSYALRFNITESKVRIDKEEFEEVVEQAHSEGLLDKEDKEMIRKILIYTHKKVKDVMVPFENVKALDENIHIEEALKKATHYRFSRYPVYKKSADSITGMIHIKDLLMNKENKKIKDIKRKVLTVNEEDHIDDVLKKMKAEKTHLAVVKRGKKPVGIITLEEIIEEFLGEIEDEVV